MPDLGLAVTLSRTLLGLGALDINDHLKFYLASSSPSPVSWDRQSVSSPFVDDDITVHRRRGKVIDQMVVEVLGASQAELATNLGELRAAVVQDSYILTMNVIGTAYQWSCESADYQVAWTGPRMIARQVQVMLSIPRSPVPLSGPF